jgi:voltage-gated potassium channel
MERLSGHEIVCGWGRMGRAVAAELERDGLRAVVIENNADKVRSLQDSGLPVVAGDATQEAVLEAAGVRRARGLVACLNDDAHNVYTVLTARSMNPDLFIVARAAGEGAEERIVRAGANRVVNPYQLGGVRLAHLLARPNVVDFLDFSMSTAGEGLRLEQLRVAASGPLAGRTLAEADLRRRFGLGVAAVWRQGRLLPNPEAGLRLEVDDLLVVLGTREALERLEQATAAR